MGKAWKQEERNVAEALGGERNPLSGMASRHTAGDVIRTEYYVDAKLSGRKNATGKRFYILEREAVEGVVEGVRDEGKTLGLLTIRFKHCSDRYVVLPWHYWDVLRDISEESMPLRKPLQMTAQGTVTTRIYRQTLQQLGTLPMSQERSVLELEWADSDGPEAAIITWESLLWLLGGDADE